MKKRGNPRLAALLPCALLLLLCACGQGGQRGQGSAAARELPTAIPEGCPRPQMTYPEWKESGVSAEDAPVSFQDPVVEEMLRNLVGKPEGEVLRSDLQAIHAIYWRTECYWSDLQSPDGLVPTGERGPWASQQPGSLEDLALCTNLQWLEFGAVEVPSLAPLTELPQLETIGFSCSQLDASVLADLADFPRLRALTVDSFTTGIENMDFLLPLADRLTYLDYGLWESFDPAVLAQMTKLDHLLLTYPPSLDFLSALPGLQMLWVQSREADNLDWGCLRAASGLQYLHIGNDGGSLTLDALRPLTKLRYLSLSFVSGLTAGRTELAAALPSLEGLDLH